MMQNIPFNRPPVLGTELNYIQQAICSDKLSGDGYFIETLDSVVNATVQYVASRS